MGTDSTGPGRVLVVGIDLVLLVFLVVSESESVVQGALGSVAHSRIGPGRTGGRQPSGNPGG